MSRKSAEIDYLAKLIADFPANYKPEEAEKAYQDIATRYQVYEKNIDVFFLYQSEIVKQSKGHWGTVLKQLAYDTHAFLFDGILSNAGEIRKKSEPNGGRIQFGGLRHQQQRAQFEGARPGLIEKQLKEAFSHLVAVPQNPIEQALRCYQRFVNAHPFYDANGRIGRVIVSIYLYKFDQYVLWAKFDGPNNSKFINRLNECHKRQDSGFRFEEYFGYLLDFFSNYVVSVEDLQDFD